MKVALIIPVYNGADFLDGLMKSLYQNWDHSIHEIHVVNNGSEDKTQEVIHLWQNYFDGDYILDRLHFLEYDLDRNIGFGSGVNLPLRKILDKGEMDAVCVFNVDQLVKPRWLEILIATLKQYVNIGMATSWVDEDHSPSVFIENQFYKVLIENLSIYVHYRLKGSPWLIRTQALKEVGIFDERFEYGTFEDSDLCLRLVLGGWEFVKVENSITFHYLGSRGQQEAKKVTGRSFDWENRIKFEEKWNTIHMYDLMPSLPHADVLSFKYERK